MHRRAAAGWSARRRAGYWRRCMPFGCAVPTALNGGAALTRSVPVSGDAPSIRGGGALLTLRDAPVNLSFTQIGEFPDPPSNIYIFYLGRIL